MNHPKNFQENSDAETLIRPTKTRKEIAIEYGIDPHTLKNWIKRTGLTIPSGDLNPKSQRIIYEAFGVPPSMK